MLFEATLIQLKITYMIRSTINLHSFQIRLQSQYEINTPVELVIRQVSGLHGYNKCVSFMIFYVNTK